MPCDALRRRFRQVADRPAIIWRDRARLYRDLLDAWQAWDEFFERAALAPGTIVALEADHSPAAVSATLSLWQRGAIVVPMTTPSADWRAQVRRIAAVQATLSLHDDRSIDFIRADQVADHALYGRLRAARRPGVVLFTSGAAGEPKGAVHDAAALLEQFARPRQALRAAAFLLFDHVGGLFSWLYHLSSGGCLVCLADRAPDAVLATMARHSVESITTTPTFLRLVLAGAAHRRHDLSSLRMVSYGAEPMPGPLLRRLVEALPGVKFVQSYGLTEAGILRTQSRAADSTWVRLGGGSAETRVVNGVLHVRTATTMLGYLNAPSPVLPDGWLDTGDRVETDGEFVRVVGRRGDFINVGGRKVFPREIEAVISELDEVADVSVCGLPNPLTGAAVCARVRPSSAGDAAELPRRVRRHCAERLERYQVPVRVELVTELRSGPRGKRAAGE